MTAAQEQLLSTVKNIDTNLQKLAAQITEEETVPPYTVSNASGISEWLMLCALRHPNGNDLRRRIEAGADLRTATAAQVMHATPRRIAPDALAVNAAEMMETHGITSVLVVGANGTLEGVVHIRDLMRAKVI